MTGGYTFLTIVDLDKDGLKDLVVDEYERAGQIRHYKNTGSKKPPQYLKAELLMIGEEILTVSGI